MIKLSQLKLEEKTIKAMIYIDEKNNIATAYGDFDEVKRRQYGEVICIYHPNKEDKTWLLEKIQEQTNIKDGEIKSELGTELVYELLKRLTDVPIDLDITRDRDMIEEIINNPSDILLVIKDELDMICNSLFIRFYNKLVEFSKYPDTLAQGMVQLSNSKKPYEEELENIKQLKIISEELLESLE